MKCGSTEFQRVFMTNLESNLLFWELSSSMMDPHLDLGDYGTGKCLTFLQHKSKVVQHFNFHPRKMSKCLGLNVCNFYITNRLLLLSSQWKSFFSTSCCAKLIVLAKYREIDRNKMAVLALEQTSNRF